MTSIILEIVADIVGSAVQEALAYAGSSISRGGSKPEVAPDHTMTCTACGRQRTVQGSQVAYWKEHLSKPRRCKVCRRMTLHKLSA